MSGPASLPTFVRNWSGRGWMEIESRESNGEPSRLSLVMDAADSRWGLQLVGYGQTFHPKLPDGKQKLFIIVKQGDCEGFVTILASPSEIDETIKEFRWHFRNKERRERAHHRREAGAEKLEIAK